MKCTAPWGEPEQATCSPWSVVSCPDPALSWGKGSICHLSNIDFEQTMIRCLHDVRPISLVYVHAWMMWHYFIGLSKIKTVDSAQPRNRSIVSRPFSSWEGGVWEWDYITHSLPTPPKLHTLPCTPFLHPIFSMVLCSRSWQRDETMSSMLSAMLRGYVPTCGHYFTECYPLSC